MEVEERKHTIVEQLGRITFLEDRFEMLQKEISNQEFHMKFKHKKIVNLQSDYNKLRGETSKQAIRQILPSTIRSPTAVSKWVITQLSRAWKTR